VGDHYVGWAQQRTPVVGCHAAAPRLGHVGSMQEGGTWKPMCTTTSSWPQERIAPASDKWWMLSQEAVNYSYRVIEWLIELRIRELERSLMPSMLQHTFKLKIIVKYYDGYNISTLIRHTQEFTSVWFNLFGVEKHQISPFIITLFHTQFQTESDPAGRFLSALLPC
jgi:hypothetical protein